MRKIKMLIISIYIMTFLIVTGVTTYLVYNSFKDNSEKYYTEFSPQQVKVQINEEHINRTIDILKKFRFLQ